MPGAAMSPGTRRQGASCPGALPAARPDVQTSVQRNVHRSGGAGTRGLPPGAPGTGCATRPEARHGHLPGTGPASGSGLPREAASRAAARRGPLSGGGPG